MSVQSGGVSKWGRDATLTIDLSLNCWRWPWENIPLIKKCMIQIKTWQAHAQFFHLSDTFMPLRWLRSPALMGLCHNTATLNWIQWQVHDQGEYTQGVTMKRWPSIWNLPPCAILALLPDVTPKLMLCSTYEQGIGALKNASCYYENLALWWYDHANHTPIEQAANWDQKKLPTWCCDEPGPPQIRRSPDHIIRTLEKHYPMTGHITSNTWHVVAFDWTRTHWLG